MNSSDSEDVLTPLLSIPQPQEINGETEFVLLSCIQSLFTNAINLLQECKGEFIYGTFDSHFDQITNQMSVVMQ